MSTTTTFSGIDADGKNSSRVLQPPGGGSSNIFGVEPAQPQRSQQRQQAGSNIFGDPYDPTRDLSRKEMKEQQHQQQQQQLKLQQQQEAQMGSYPTPQRAQRPQENTQSNLFGDAGRPVSQSGLVKRGGKGGEFPAYDKRVYAAQINDRINNIGKPKEPSFNIITGATYAGHEGDEVEEHHYHGKKKAPSSTIGLSDGGAYNPITGQDYADNQPRQQHPGQQQAQHGNGDNASFIPQGENPQRNSSRVLAPPGGRSDGLW